MPNDILKCIGLVELHSCRTCHLKQIPVIFHHMVLRHQKPIPQILTEEQHRMPADQIVGLYAHLLSGRLDIPIQIEADIILF